MRPRQGEGICLFSRPIAAVTHLSVLLLALVVVVAACSQGNPVPISGSTTSAATSQSSDSDTLIAPSKLPADIAELFGHLAVTSAPMIIYGPSYVPTGCVLADEWWPVLEMTEPVTHEGPAVANPRVVGTGADREIQVILRSRDGWLVILENFRGDLGDVVGRPVGSVDGNRAALYAVNGGELVQWSEKGRWYGVFGRGVDQDELIAVALGMRREPNE